MEPLVSILIPAFNAQPWIAATIDSALRQTWQRKEIIVVDDGSTDQTLSIAQRFASGTVSVVAKRNEGAAATRNKAFELSQGEYIQWLDADDLLAPDKVSMQMRARRQASSGRTLLSSEWGHFIHRTRKADFVPTALWCDLSPVEWLLRKLEQGIFMQTASWLVSRELTAAAGPWDTRLLGDDDGEYFCRVIMASDGIQFVPGAKVFYRRSGSQRLSYVGRSNPKLEAAFLSMQMHIRYLQSLEDTPRTRSACVRFLQDNIFTFYPQRPDIVTHAQELAATLGGQLDVPPRLPRKYAWIQKSFGWDVAKRAQLLLPQVKWSLIRAWDNVLFRMERHPLGPSLAREVVHTAGSPQ